MTIQISILTDGWIKKELTGSLFNWLKECPYDTKLEFTEEKPTEHCRNRIVRDFLNSKAEYLLMIDNDVVPLQNPLSLIQQNKDIIACPCPIYQETKTWNCYKLDAEKYWRPIEIAKDASGLIEVDAVGTGCILIKKNVLENIKAPFARIFNEDGTEKLGQDLAFSVKAKDKGFKIYISIDHKCSHYKTFDLAQNIF